jgi:hypothetical protein
MKPRTIGGALFACAITIAAGPPPKTQSVLDLPYAPTPAGRVQFMDVAAGTFGPMVALATACHKRSQS